MTAGNPDLVNNDMEIEKYSPQCGDSVSNPPVNVYSITRTLREDVILASSPDGVFRLQISDYRQLQPDHFPTFCWTKMGVLASRDIQSMQYVGQHLANDVWLMTAASNIFAVEANPLSRNSRISIRDLTDTTKEGIARRP